MKKTIYVKPETECIEPFVLERILDIISGDPNSDEELPEEGDANTRSWDKDDGDYLWNRGFSGGLKSGEQE